MLQKGSKGRGRKKTVLKAPPHITVRKFMTSFPSRKVSFFSPTVFQSFSSFWLFSILSVQSTPVNLHFWKCGTYNWQLLFRWLSLRQIKYASKILFLVFTIKQLHLWQDVNSDISLMLAHHFSIYKGNGLNPWGHRAGVGYGRQEDLWSVLFWFCMLVFCFCLSSSSHRGRMGNWLSAPQA